MRIVRHVSGIAAAICLIGLTACDDPGARAALGAGIGAGVGSVLGSQIGSGAGQTIATAAGASLGAYAGGRLFAALPAADRRQARLAQAEALESAPSGQSVTWCNPDTGSSGEVNVQPAFAAADGGPCRHFAHRIEVDGRQESVAGTACRQTDGAWQVVAEE